MSNVCALPVRYTAGAAADPRMVSSAHALADALEFSDEFQTFARLASEVSQDSEVTALLNQIRLHHSYYNKAQNGELVAQLESLPIMVAYQAAEQALRSLCAAVDDLIGAEAGLSFSQYIRPLGHG